MTGDSVVFRSALHCVSKPGDPIFQFRATVLSLAGNARGLARFDGVRFAVYNSGNTPAIPENNIVKLQAGRDGGSAGLRLRCAEFGSFRAGQRALAEWSQIDSIQSPPPPPILSPKAHRASRFGACWFGLTGPR
jgi:hypothetical protein